MSKQLAKKRPLAKRSAIGAAGQVKWMGHSTFLGMTGSGKSTLATARAQRFKQAGVFVLVLDPFGNDWPCDFKTDDLSLFIAEAKAQRRCALFIEEAGDYGKDPNFLWLFTQSRHWGHVAHFICQRHTQVPPIVRDQCQNLFLFRCSATVAKIWAEDFAQPQIETLAARCPPYHFVAANRGQSAPLMCVLMPDGSIRIVETAALPAPLTLPAPKKASEPTIDL